MRKGPPQPLLRVTGPFIVLSTIAVLATGTLLGIHHQSSNYGGYSLLFLYKLSVVGGWAVLMTVHVLAYLPRLRRLLAADAVPGRAVRAVGGRGLRYGLVLLSLGAGAILANWSAHLSGS